MSLHHLHCDSNGSSNFHGCSSPSLSGLHLNPWSFTYVVNISLRLLRQAFNGSIKSDLCFLLVFLLSTITIHAWIQTLLFRAAPTDVLTQTSEGICFTIFTGRFIEKNPFHGFFQLIRVWCNELRVSGFLNLPQVLGKQGSEAFRPADWRISRAMG